VCGHATIFITMVMMTMVVMMVVVMMVVTHFTESTHVVK
jgi:hypothetical protein